METALEALEQIIYDPGEEDNIVRLDTTAGILDMMKIA